MDALILSCGTGGGHDAAAQAVREQLIRRGHRVTMMNPYSLKSDRVSVAINRLYIRLVQEVPRVFGAIYCLGELYRKLPWRSPVYFLNGKMVHCMQEFLEQNHFDVVFLSHLFPAEILTSMKQKGLPVPKTVFITTDYTCIPFVEETDCDVYVIPSTRLVKQFTAYGIPPEKLRAYGIPVSRAFAEPLTRQQALHRLELDSDKRYILVSGGSMGAGKISQVVRILLKCQPLGSSAKLIVLCGNNQALYHKLHKQYDGQIILLDYTNRMAEYLAACDLFISKPGGLSSTEAAVLGTPIVHITPIPGCETVNMDFFAKNSMCMPVKSPHRSLVGAIYALQRPETCQEMIVNQRLHTNPHAADDICRLAENILS